jgi:2-oxoisovalerate dehydrogenase E2 component (dihydrolipoyl transacylase)
MGAFQFKLPDIGEGTAEAEIVAWHVKVGDKVKEDQPLVDMMTDKATVELTSPVDGIVQSIGGEVGKKAAVGAVLVTFQTEGGADLPAAKPKEEKKAAAPAPAPAPKPEPVKPAPVVHAAPAAVAKHTAPGARPAASPAVRRRADELGVKLQYVPGTGPQGRITHQDLDTFVASGGKGAVVARGKVARTGIQDIPVIGMRRQIAERMQLAKRHIPHFTYVEEVDMTAVDELRAAMNATKKKEQPKLTVLPFFMLTMAKALEDFPQINALYDDEAGVVHRYEGVHIGMAAQTDKGLMVPVVRHVESLDIWALAGEIARLAAAARDGKAKREELMGSTITLTSLGTLGGVVATPVINRPEVGIICPNKIIERPVVKNGQIVVRKMMNLSSSFDHRVVDGADAAAFIQRMKVLLEQPALIFMP